MKKVLLILLVLLAALSIYWFVIRTKKSIPKGPKQAPIALKAHSDTFNTSIDRLMASYHEIKNAFVDADKEKAKQYTTTFIGLLDSIPLNELRKDTATIYESARHTVADVKANAESLIKQTDITEMRKDFQMVTEMLYPAFFQIINYEGPKLYLQHCPMAFDGSVGANWISDKAEVVNPYLGKKHPKYRGTMLHCGEVMDSIYAK